MTDFTFSGHRIRVPGQPGAYTDAIQARSLSLQQLRLLYQLSAATSHPGKFDHLPDHKSCWLPIEAINAGITRYKSELVDIFDRFVAKAGSGEPTELNLLAEAFAHSVEAGEPSALILQRVLLKRFKSSEQSRQLALITSEAIGLLRNLAGSAVFSQALLANYPAARNDEQTAVLHHHVTRMFQGSAGSAKWVVEYGCTQADLDPANFDKTWEEFFYASHGRDVSTRRPEAGKFI